MGRLGAKAGSDRFGPDVRHLLGRAGPGAVPNPGGRTWGPDDRAGLFDLTLPQGTAAVHCQVLGRLGCGPLPVEPRFGLVLCPCLPGLFGPNRLPGPPGLGGPPWPNDLPHPRPFEPANRGSSGARPGVRGAGGFGLSAFGHCGGGLGCPAGALPGPGLFFRPKGVQGAAKPGWDR